MTTNAFANTFLILAVFILFPLHCSCAMDKKVSRRTEIVFERVQSFQYCDYSFNVDYRYGRDSLNHYLQKQYAELFFRKTDVEYGRIRVFLLIKFEKKRIDRVLIFAPHFTTDLDSRIITIINESLSSIKRSDWLYTDNNHRCGASVAFFQLY